VVLPFGSSDGIVCVEDSDYAGLAAVMSPTFLRRNINGLFRSGNALRLFMQGRLIFLELNDQMGARFLGGFECFFDSAWRRA